MADFGFRVGSLCTGYGEAVELCRAECRSVGDDPIGWTLARAREIDGGSDASVWQALGERHTAACIARATLIATAGHRAES